MSNRICVCLSLGTEQKETIHTFFIKFDIGELFENFTDYMNILHGKTRILLHENLPVFLCALDFTSFYACAELWCTCCAHAVFTS